MDNQCGYRKTNNGKGLKQMNVGQLKKKLVEKYTDRVSKMDRSSLCLELEQEAPLPLYNQNNSCYIDSILISLLYPIIAHGMNNIWYKYLLVKPVKSDDAMLIRKELLSILENLESITKMDGSSRKTCNMIRSIFHKDKKYNSGRGNEWLRSQQDPVDVIYMLEHMFAIPDINQFKLSNDNNEKSCLIGIQIQSYMMKHSEKLSFRKFFPTFTDTDTKIKRTYVKGSMIYIQVNRNYNNVEKIKREFIAPRKTGAFVLQSIVLHLGNDPKSGHYVSVMRVNSTRWVYFDDMSDKLEYFLDTDLYKIKNSIVAKNCAGLLYMRI